MIVLRKGATTETYSSINLDQFDALKFLPQIRRDPAGNPMVSPELPVQVLMQRANGPTRQYRRARRAAGRPEVHERCT